MKRNRANDRRPAFTVTELLVVLSILALLTAMSVSALANAAEQARAQRTRAIIDKIDQLIVERWESYRTRAIPYVRHPDPRQNALNRLNALRELQRLELPMNAHDIWDNPQYLVGNALPAVARGYRRRCLPEASWNGANEEAECLYLIISSMRDGEKNAIEFFTSSEIGDLDGDGQLEILDGWGQPIVFVRWPTGYVNNHLATPALTTQVNDGVNAPDPFDPLKADPRFRETGALVVPFAMMPLVYSVGPDGESGVQLPDADFHYSATSTDRPYPNDPYAPIDDEGKDVYVGEIFSRSMAADNITNHFRE